MTAVMPRDSAHCQPATPRQDRPGHRRGHRHRRSPSAKPSRPPERLSPSTTSPSMTRQPSSYTDWPDSRHGQPQSRPDKPQRSQNSRPAEILAAVRPVNILVNNAGTYPRVPWHDMTDTDWTFALETNLTIHYRVNPHVHSGDDHPAAGVLTSTSAASPLEPGEETTSPTAPLLTACSGSPAPSPANSAPTESASTPPCPAPSRSTPRR